MKRKSFLYLILLLVIQLQIIYPIPTLAQTVSDTSSQDESSDNTQLSENIGDGTKSSEATTGSSIASSTEDSNTSETTTDSSFASSTEDSNTSETTTDSSFASSTEDSNTSEITTDSVTEPTVTLETTTVGTWGTVPWSFDSLSGTLTFTGTGNLGLYTASPWNQTNPINASLIKKLVFTNTVVAPSSSEFLFSSYSSSANQLTSVTSIEGLQYLDTSQVQNMSYMFYNMSSITSLNLSTFNTNKATNFYCMFAGDLKLENLNISSFNTQNGSTSLMFSRNNSLSSLTLGSNFRSKGTSLPSINQVNGYSGNWMNKATNVSVGNSDTFIANYDGSAPGTYVWQRQLWNDVPWEFNTTTGVLTFLDGGTLGGYNSSPWNRSDDLKIDPSSITQITFTKSVQAPKISNSLFSSGTNDSKVLNNVTQFNGLSYLDTSNVTDMSSMFFGMSSLTSIDLSNFNTSQVTTMHRMFARMSSLKELDVTHFNTANVTRMSNMFQLLTSINTLDISTFNTSKVTDMYAMFDGITSVNVLNLENFDFSKNTNYRNMFKDDPIQSITLSASFSDKNNSSLLTSVPDNDTYNGTWLYQTNGQNVGTTTEFLANYDGKNPGTYVWESKEDPLDPTNPTQDSLILKSVPSAYSFKSGLLFSDYKINGTVSTDNQVIVYNNRMDRNWSVKASVVDNQLTLKNGLSTTLPVDNFTINSSNILNPQTKGIVASSPVDKTSDNNVGDITTDISNVSVEFTDMNHQLKVGSELQGTIRYQLYNTASAE